MADGDRQLAGDARATVTDLQAWLQRRTRRPDVVTFPTLGGASGSVPGGAGAARRRLYPHRPVPAFTPRERALLALLDCTPDDELAGLIGVDEHIVRAHVDRILAKYAAAGRPARSRAHLALRAFQDGFDEPPALGAVHS